MVRWLLRRLALAVVVVAGAATITFAGLHLTPGDPALAILDTPSPPPRLLAQVHSDLGLDHPVLVQYGLFMGRLARGDLGRSYQLNERVTHVLDSQLPSTLELALAGFTLALVTSVALAVVTAGRPGFARRLSATLELLAISSPGFWVGILLLTFLSFRAHLFPVAGGSGPRALVLPAVTLAIGLVGVFTQVLRAELERVLHQPFVLSSRARGTTETSVRLRHALRHAFTPMLTLTGWTVGSLLTGSVVVETVFSRQGLGRVLATAITGHDLPVVTGVVVVSATTFTVVNLVIDVLYRVLDPRLRDVRP